MLDLLARAVAVGAFGFLAVHELNHIGSLSLFGGTGDATVFFAGQMQGLAHMSLQLMSIGGHVLVFLGLA